MVGSRILRITALLFMLPFVAAAQENRYMVFFTDKEGIPQTISKPIDFLSERAIQRRMDQNISITAEDLPVSKSYVAGVMAAGATVLYTSRWVNGALIHCPPAVVTEVEALPYVDRVEYVAPPGREPSGGRRSAGFRKNNNNIGIDTEGQLKMLGLDQMHRDNFDGEGIVIAVLDSGFPGVDQAPAFQALFAEGRFDAEVSHNFISHTSNVFTDDDHGTEVLSVIVGEVPDAFTGGARGVSLQLFVTEEVPTEYRVEEYNWMLAAERADSAGADIIHSSLGYYDFDDASMNYSADQMDGKTTVVTQAARMAVDRGMVVVVSAGNEGHIPSWRIVTAPADAEGVLAVGSVNSVRQRVSSSSIGPTSDGRIKPDLAALGSGVRVVKANGQISTASGTSLAAPLVTSLVAGVMQRQPELSARQVVDLLRQTASQAGDPDNLLGYGIPNYQAIVNYQDEDDQAEAFVVFPNPLRDSDTLTIRPNDPEAFDSCQIEIVTAQGRVLVSRRVQFDWLNRSYRTTLAGLPAGPYYVRIYSDKRKETFKIVKLR